MAAPIIMVHGAFCGGWVFETFAAPFAAAGHEVLTPDLRGHGAGERRDAATGLSMADYAQDIAQLAESLPEPPILIGHSMGGLVCQMAASRARVRALALLAPSAPWGVTGNTVEEAVTAFGLHLMGPFWTQAVEPDLNLMRQYSLSRLPRAEREAAIARLRPESGRALWETLNWWLDPFMTTSVSLAGRGCPSLALVGEKDVVHPPATVRQTAARLGAGCEVLPGMSHWLVGEPGWRDVSARLLDWMDREVRAAA
ncbi:alpha/beta hydrolase [Phenylobacterium sp.]|jgi:pimeloyl-ACP methyl ester carboxylesterase|uniref:alpha/beta hydrolase n=1 Tax=Phenylobacterium sp. TaxID=1871053 RepID=UPI002E3186BB|nr:alpha/beta fold hydrolase [Phenylobacterium sp.]HEX2558488.1 alpha/beta fold hydrolase [Phenylobacterium sp.]